VSHADIRIAVAGFALIGILSAVELWPRETYRYPSQIVSGAQSWYGLRPYSKDVTALFNARQRADGNVCVIAGGNDGNKITLQCVNKSDEHKTLTTFCGSGCVVTCFYNQAEPNDHTCYAL
jgi:hypothetical protein